MNILDDNQVEWHLSGKGARLGRSLRRRLSLRSCTAFYGALLVGLSLPATGDWAAEAQQYWNAGGSTGNFVGGPGTWSANGLVWTTDNTASTANAAWQQNGLAIFDGTSAGNVTIDSSTSGGGVINVSGMTFNIDGYTLQPANQDVLTLVAPAQGSPVTINVDTAASASATITAVLAGSADLLKTGDGILVLTAANTFTGSVTVSGGTLLAADADSIGPSSDVTIENGATLSTYALQNWDITSLTIGTGGGVLAAQLVTPISTGDLQGAGDLELNTVMLTVYGTSTYSGTITVDENAELFLGSTGAKKNVTLAGDIVLGHQNSVLIFQSTSADQATPKSTYSGKISNSASGTLIKVASGTTVLTADSSAYSGPTTLYATLELATNAKLGGAVTSDSSQSSPALVMGGGSALTGSVTLGGGVTVSGNTTNAQAVLGAGANALTISGTNKFNLTAGTSSNTSAIFTTGDLSLAGTVTVNVDTGSNPIASGTSYEILAHGALSGSAISSVFQVGTYIGEYGVLGSFSDTNSIITLDFVSALIDQYWNPGGSTGNYVGGPGTWTASGNNVWYADAQASGSGQGWNAPYGVAHFAGTGGSVTVASGTSFDVAGMSFESGGYSLDYASGQTTTGLNLSPATGKLTPIKVKNSGDTATINIGLASDLSTGIAVSGDGTLVLAGNNTFHSMTITDATVSVSATENLGSSVTNSGITMSGATLLATGDITISHGLTFDTTAVSTLTAASGASIEIAGNMNGSAPLTTNGKVILDGVLSNYLYNGDITVASGTFQMGSGGNDGVAAGIASIDVLDGATLLAIGGKNNVTGIGSKLTSHSAAAAFNITTHETEVSGDASGFLGTTTVSSSG